MAATLSAALEARQFKAAADRDVVKPLGRARDAAGRFTKGVDKADRKLKGFAGTAKNVRGVMVGLLAGFTAFAAVRSSVQILGQFEEKMALVGAVSGASATQIEALEDAARTMGATTRFSASEAAEGLLFLARAGFEVQESIDALPATLNLAQVGMISLGQAADFASNIVAQFNLAATETSRVVDALVIASNRANTSVSQAAEAMKFSGTVLGQLGIQVEEAANLIGVLGDRGIQASMAGTNLRAVFLKLQAPTAAGSEALKKYGLSLQDVDFRSNASADVFERLLPLLKDTAAAVDIFGIRNVSAAQTIALSTDRLRELEQAQRDNVGEAERVARAVDDTLVGAFKSLISATQEGVLALGDSGLTGGLRKFVDTLTGAVRVITGSATAQKEVTSESILTASALTGLVSGFVAYKAAIAGLKLASFIANLGGARKAMIALNTAIAANPAIIAAASVAVISAAFIKFANDAAEAERAYLRFINTLFDNQQGTIRNLEALERASFDLKRAIKFDNEAEQFAVLARQAKLLEDTLFSLNKEAEKGGRIEQQFRLADIANALPEQDARKLAESLGLDFEGAIKSGVANIPRSAFIEAIEGAIRGLESAAKSAPPIDIELPVDPQIEIDEAKVESAREQILNIARTLDFEKTIVSESRQEQQLARFERDLTALAVAAEFEQVEKFVGALVREKEATLNAAQAAAEKRAQEQEDMRAREASIESTARLLEGVKEEQKLIGLTNEERRKQIALLEFERAAAGLTAEEREKLKMAYETEIEVLERLQKEQEKSQEAARIQAELAGSIGDSLRGGLEDAIIELDNLEEIGKRVFEEIRRAAVRAAIAAAFGGGGTPFPGFSLGAGPAMGMGFSGGGRMMPGLQKGGVIGEQGFIQTGGTIRPVAEKGPEAVMPLARGRGGELGVQVADTGGQVKAQQTLIMNIQGVTDTDSFRRNERQMSRKAGRFFNRKGQ